MKTILRLTCRIFFFGFTSSLLIAQMSGLHGDDKEFRSGVHDGNQFRVSFFNDGTYGSVGNSYQPGIFIGEWPINGGMNFLVDGNIFIGAEVKDTSGNIIHVFSENRSAGVGGASGDKRPDGSWRTFAPLTGFAKQQNNRIAMSIGSEEKENSWPSFWPDIADTSNSRYSADGWAGSWNGYFGKDVFNADEESYFVSDDYQNDEFQFYPDSNDLNRRGLGIRMYARGFQWSMPSMEDALILHYDFLNIGTAIYNKTVVGYKIANSMGEVDPTHGDYGDDNNDFNRTLNLIYKWDMDDVGGDGRTPVGYFGTSFLETPGNAYDGIDNDNDGLSGTGWTISEAMFQQKTLALNAELVFINYNTYQRVITTLHDTLSSLGKTDNDSLAVNYNGNVFYFKVGKKVNEIGDNMFDDNLNGLIDENRSAEISPGGYNYLYDGYKYIDYLTGIGKDNLLIDERRDDGIDNNGDWDPSKDDVGTDGISGTNDSGENDGVPTVGEPHFDGTDINESDMIGLTSVLVYVWNSAVGSQQSDDQWLWENLIPGKFEKLSGNIQLLFGSGYFPLGPNQSQRISLGIMCAPGKVSDGSGLSNLIEKKSNVAAAYEGNYRLPRRPELPVLQGECNGNIVTLQWNDIAEKTLDPVLGDDFEGYRLYRSMDSCYFDSTNLIAQFDKDNEFSGYFPIALHGKYFWLGSNTGLENTFVDSNLIFGHDYYYAITAYDHGSVSKIIPPAESMINGMIDVNGNPHLSKNIVAFTPVDSLGQNYPTSVEAVNGITTGSVKCEIVDTRYVRSNHTYRITFQDTIIGLGLSGFIGTRNFKLTDVSVNETVLNNIRIVDLPYSYHILHGFRLTLENARDGVAYILKDSSGWKRSVVPEMYFERFYSGPVSYLTEDVKVIINDSRTDTSKYFRVGGTLYPPLPVNFSVINAHSGKKVNFAFREQDTLYGNSIGGSRKGVFSIGRNAGASYSDEIIFLSKVDSPWVTSWTLKMSRPTYVDPVTGAQTQPYTGDTLTVKFNKPFLSSDVFEFTIPDIPVGVEELESNLPTKYFLSQNYPNPFNPATTIKYQLPAASYITLKIFDMLGRDVETLINEEKAAGYYSVAFNASRLSSGVYFYRLQSSAGFTKTMKLVLLK